MSYQLVKLLWGLLPIFGMLIPLRLLVRAYDNIDDRFPDLARQQRFTAYYAFYLYVALVAVYILIIPALITLPDYQVP